MVGCIYEGLQALYDARYRADEWGHVVSAAFVGRGLGGCVCGVRLERVGSRSPVCRRAG